MSNQTIHKKSTSIRIETRILDLFEGYIKERAITRSQAFEEIICLGMGRLDLVVARKEVIEAALKYVGENQGPEETSS